MGLSLNKLIKKIAVTVYSIPQIRKRIDKTLKNIFTPVRPLTSYQSMGEFHKDNGDKLTLLKGLRDDIKPVWKEVVNPPKKINFPGKEALKKKAERCRKNIEEISALANAYGAKLEGKKILEIGCFDGIHAFYLSLISKVSVVASDISKYYIIQTPDKDLNEDDGSVNNLSHIFNLTLESMQYFHQNP